MAFANLLTNFADNSFFAGGTHRVTTPGFLGIPTTRNVTDLDDTNSCAGLFQDSNRDGHYSAGSDKVFAMDLNHDGKITRSDLTGTKERFQAMGGNFDFNHDGKTSFGETIKGSAYRKDMQKKDQNHDGRIDANEFDQAGGRVLIDRNRDGQLTPNESYSPFHFPASGFGSGHLNFIDPMRHEISTSRNPSPWQGGPFGGGFGGFPGGGFPGGGFPGGGFPGQFPGGFGGGGFGGGFPGGGFPGQFPTQFPGQFPMMPGMQGGCF